MSPQFNSRKWTHWTDAEKAFLRENYGLVPVAEIAGTLGRSAKTTQMQAGRLGLTSPGGRPWSEADRDFLRQNYHGGVSVAEIAERLGRTCGTVTEQAGRLGLRVSRGDDWTADEDAYLRLHYEAIGGSEAARHLGRTAGSVRRHARRLGLVPETEKLRAIRRAAIRHDYFSAINTPTKAWVLGWLATDGYVTNTVGITLSIKDAHIVEMIRDQLAPFHPIIRREASDHRHASGRIIKGGPSVEFRVVSAKMQADLARYGVTPRKSHTLQYPKIPVRFDNSFILGCFEGDGTLGRKSGGRYGWGLYSASVPFLLAVQARVHDALGFELHGPYRSSTIYKVITQHQQRIRMLDTWLHADIEGLARKRLPRLLVPGEQITLFDEYIA